MKKQTRNLCIAAAALVILGGIYLAVSSQEEQPETVAVGNLADMDVTGFSYSNADGTWNFAKTDGAWTNADDATCPINNDTMQELVDAIQGLTADRSLETPDDDADYGLDDPDYTVTLSDGSENVTLTASVQDTVTYLKLSEGDTVYATSSALPEGLDNGLTDWIAYDNIPYATEDSLTEIVWNDMTVTRVMEDTAEAETEDSQADTDETADETADEAGDSAEDEEEAVKWQITDASGTRTVEQDTTMDAFLNDVRGLYVLACADYGIATEQEKQTYGLDDPDSLHVTYTTEDGTASYTIAIGASNGDDGYYAMLDDNGIVLVLESAGVDALRSVSLADA